MTDERKNIYEENIDDKEGQQDDRKKDEEQEPEFEELTAEYADEEEKKASESSDLVEQLTRLQADFVNYKKRTEKERLDRIAYANCDLVKDLLPVLDDLERALENVTEEDAFSDGVKMVYEKLLSILEREGLKVIDSDDQPFDHNYHQAIATEEREGVEEGIVIETLQKGYMFKDKCIRPSMVKVSK